MARVRKSGPAAARAGAAADELGVLFPDRDLPLSAGTVTVRELRFEDQIRHNAALAPLADALAGIPPDVLAGDDGINLILDTLAAHWDGVRALVAASIDKPQEWVSGLSGPDGEALLMTWWSVNQGFFLRRLLRPTLVRRAMQQAGAGSSPPSSQPATGAPNSAATPPGS